jgi:uncharacterized membrane protein YoaK (UPF0700 family)
MENTNRDRTEAVALGFLAGYVDTLGFIALFGLFTAHVTGNFILIGANLASVAANPGVDAGHMTLLLKLLAFPAFILGVAAVPVLIGWAAARNARALPLALGLQLVLLAAFMLFGMAAIPLGAAPGDLAIVAGLFGAAAMGVHSAISRLLMAHLAPTSMMTGNVTQVVIDVMAYLRGERGGGHRRALRQVRLAGGGIRPGRRRRGIRVACGRLPGPVCAAVDPGGADPHGAGRLTGQLATPGHIYIGILAAPEGRSYHGCQQRITLVRTFCNIT